MGASVVTTTGAITPISFHGGASGIATGGASGFGSPFWRTVWMCAASYDARAAEVEEDDVAAEAEVAEEETRDVRTRPRHVGRRRRRRRRRREGDGPRVVDDIVDRNTSSWYAARVAAS
jgi:hypothetical protein